MSREIHYRATVVRVVDGDSVLVDLDFGFNLTARKSCRLLGSNSFERREPGGEEAKAYLTGLLPVGSAVPVVSVKRDPYRDRFVGRIELPDGRDAAAVMIEAGFSVAWDGTGPRPKPVWPIPVRKES